MSYILDALKKSEQERGHGNVPGVQTVHSSSINYYNERKTYWPYILIAAVILNLIAILYFILDKETPIENIIATEPGSSIDRNIQLSPKKTTEDSDVILKKDSPVEKKLIGDNDKKTYTKEPAPAVTPTVNSSKPDNFQADDNVIDTEIRERPAKIIDYHDLPESIKLQLPAIIISAHVYSTNPVQRSIVINNNFLEEGEYIIDDLVLDEITPDGAILDYHGTLFRYGAVSSWQ